MSNRLGSRSISGWEADQLHKCAVWQARGFCTPQPRICARCTKVWRACAHFPWARCAFEFFSQFCIVLALLLCCGVNPCAYERLFFCADDAEFLLPCADEISVITIIIEYFFFYFFFDYFLFLMTVLVTRQPNIEFGLK
jgi:hypothetical protein